MKRIFKHNKTGQHYELKYIAQDCTNARSEKLVAMAVYRLTNTKRPIFTRDMAEFKEKFTEI